jgi:sugar phosphate isomerase/epimerase
MDDLVLHRTMTVFEWIDMARPLRGEGVSGLEMYRGFFQQETGHYLREVRDRLSDSGFAMPMLCVSPDFTVEDSTELQHQLDQQREAIDIAAFFGAATCRVLSGQRRPHLSVEAGIDRVVECIETLIPHAESCGVVLAMENHFKDNYWQYPEFAQKMEVFCRIIHRIESPWFGVQFDPSNTLLAGEDPLELLSRVAERVVSMHASDRRPKPGVALSTETVTDYSHLIHGEIGTGVIDFPAIFTMLEGAGFCGWVSIEDGMQGMEEMARSARFLRTWIHH